MKILELFLIAIIGTTFSFGSAHAATIITPTGAISTTTVGGSRTIDAAIDGTGLSGGGLSGDILTETHASAGGSTGYYLSDAYSPAANVANEVLTFDLGNGAAFDVNAIHLWAYNRIDEEGRGIITFDIAFSTDGGSNFSAPVLASSLGMSDFSLGVSDSSATSAVQSRAITTQFGVTDIQISNITNGGSDRIGLAEIRFGAAPVPEPTTAMLSGLAGLMLLLRRRRCA